MRKNIFKVFHEHFRNTDAKWLLVHKHGEYQYRSPDSVFIHRFNIFNSQEDALHYINNNIALVDREEWTLYQEVSVS